MLELLVAMIIGSVFGNITYAVTMEIFALLNGGTVEVKSVVMPLIRFFLSKRI